jgi:hypothetical protein
MSLEKIGGALHQAEMQAGGDGESRRCWGCRQLWPRTSMQWGTVSEGPLWFPRLVRVLRCPDCLT